MRAGAQAYGATVAPAGGTASLTSQVPGWRLAITAAGWRLSLPDGTAAAQGRWSAPHAAPRAVTVLAAPGAMWISYGPELAYAASPDLAALPAVLPAWSTSLSASVTAPWAVALPAAADQQHTIGAGAVALTGRALDSLRDILRRTAADITVAAAWGGQTTSTSIDLAPGAHGAQPGDRIILAVGTGQQDYGWAPAVGAGWQVLLDRHWDGTLRSSILVSPALADGASRIAAAASAAVEAGWQAVAVRGMTSAPVAGAPKARAEAPAETTTVTCPSTVLRAPGLALAVAFERTYAPETAEQITLSAPDGWTDGARTVQAENPQTVATAWRAQREAGPTGDVVFTWPSSQAANGLGIQLYLPGAARAGAPAWTPPPAGPATVTGYLLAATSTEPAYVAHRCASAAVAGDEYTTEGIAAASSAGYRAVEVSVYRCATGEYVGSHDWTVQRTTGQPYQIWRTPWSTLAALEQTGGHRLRTLDELADEADRRGMIICLDHKASSSTATPGAGDQDSHRHLIAWAQARYGAALPERVVWKHFAASWGADLARTAGMRTMAMLYDTEVDAADLAAPDILGLEYGATAAHWQALTATGKPTIAHIITSAAQARQALARGASILMCSDPAACAPGTTY